MQGLLELADVPYVGPGSRHRRSAWTRTSSRPCCATAASRWRGNVRSGSATRSRTRSATRSSSSRRGSAPRSGSRRCTRRASSSGGRARAAPRREGARGGASSASRSSAASSGTARRRSPPSWRDRRRTPSGTTTRPSTTRAGRTSSSRPAYPTSERARVQELAVDSFVATECEGMARVDFFVRRDGQVVVNELNTIPGFTATSVYAKLFEASGIPYAELLDRLVQLALERHERRSGSGLLSLESLTSGRVPVEGPSLRKSASLPAGATPRPCGQPRARGARTARGTGPPPPVLGTSSSSSQTIPSAGRKGSIRRRRPARRACLASTDARASRRRGAEVADARRSAPPRASQPDERPARAAHLVPLQPRIAWSSASPPAARRRRSSRCDGADEQRAVAFPHGVSRFATTHLLTAPIDGAQPLPSRPLILLASSRKATPCIRWWASSLRRLSFTSCPGEASRIADRAQDRRDRDIVVTWSRSWITASSSNRRSAHAAATRSADARRAAESPERIGPELGISDALGDRRGLDRDRRSRRPGSRRRSAPTCVRFLGLRASAPGSIHPFDRRRGCALPHARASAGLEGELAVGVRAPFVRSTASGVLHRLSRTPRRRS